MLADSVKVQGFSCFKDNWVGFDEFKPITVIIGRNNSGKSHLIDLVETLTKKPQELHEFSFAINTVLDEEFLRRHFRENTSGGSLSGNHWTQNGIEMIGRNIEWKFDCKTGQTEVGMDEVLNVARVSYIEDDLLNVSSVLGGKVFRRIAADRDVGQEAPADSIQLSWDGEGATDVIRRHLNSRTDNFPETLIKNEVLDGLSTVFGPDGDFTDIRIREDDENDEEDKKWEIFLYETGKEPAPLSKSGSGLKTVLLVLLNLLVIPRMEGKEEGDYVFAFEELENNLHPALLRRLFDFLTEYVRKHKCHLFLTTHSSVALDYFSTLEEAQIIQVTHDGTSANAETIKSHFDQVGVLNELGAKPSDLLQANGIIWLEGPSDRIFINKFIELFSDGELLEGRHYQCAFYGGSVIKRVMFTPPVENDDSRTNLLRVNNNIAVICDGDRVALSGRGSRLKKAVSDIKKQVEEIPDSYLWITDAKEIENYIPGGIWACVYEVSTAPDPGKYDRFPSKAGDDNYFKKHFGIATFDKTKFAAEAVPHLTLDNLKDRFDMNEQMEKLVETIRTWNN